MNSRERLLNVLNGKTVDRVPISPFIHSNFVCEFFSNTQINIIEKTIDVYDYFDFDIMHRTCSVRDYLSEVLCDSKNWSVEELKEESDDGKEWTTITTIKTPEKKLTQKKRYKKVTEYETVEAVIEYFIKDKSDLEQFIKYQPQVPRYNCDNITMCRELLGNRGVAAPFAQGAFNTISWYRKLDELILDPYMDYKFYDNMIKYFSNRMLKAIGQFIHAGADIICCGGNVANATMVGPAHFKKYVQPYEIEFTKSVKDLGAYYLYHNCGDAKALLNLYSKIKMDIYESLTPPPYGDTILEEALERIDNNITLIGNIDQIDFLKNASEDQIKEKVKQLLQTVKKRGNFILGTTDYFSERTPYKNIKAFAEAGFEYGSYI